jgi:hypothetical protein
MRSWNTNFVRCFATLDLGEALGSLCITFESRWGRSRGSLRMAPLGAGPWTADP